jgi:hypothetical protein
MSQVVAVGVNDRARRREALLSCAERVASLVRPLTDTSIRIPKSEWTVGEAAAHLAITKPMLAEMIRTGVMNYGDGDHHNLAETNAGFLSRFGERKGEPLAELIVKGTQDFVEAAALLDQTTTRRTPMGMMDIDTATAYTLTHLMMHGYTISRALHKPNPIRAEDVEMAMPFLVHAMGVIEEKQKTKNLNACIELRMRGGGPRLAFMFDKGELTIASKPSRKVDCVISADPVAFFLVGTRLASQWPMIAKFKLLTWGTKPWLAMRFAGFFLPP